MNALVISTLSKMVLLDGQLFDGHDMATPRATLDPDIIPDATPLTMGLCEGGVFIAVATRDVDDPARLARKKKPTTKPTFSHDSADCSDGSGDIDSSDSDTSTTSTEDSDNSAYETCSEGSTDVDGASDSDGSPDISSGEDHDTASLSSDSEAESTNEIRRAKYGSPPWRSWETHDSACQRPNEAKKRRATDLARKTRPTSGPWGPPHGHAEGVPPQQRRYIDSDFSPQTIRSNLALWLPPSMSPKRTACGVASGRKRSAFCGFRGEDIFCQNDNANQAC